jgi:hypothetical protein
MAVPQHVQDFSHNMDEVGRLLDIHQKLTGSGPGRRHNVEVLNRSALVLTVACWEAFIEDLAESAFDFMLRHAKKPTVFPNRVLALASKKLREHRDESKVWDLAASGWRSVLRKHRQAVLRRYIGSFNTPRPKQV